MVQISNEPTLETAMRRQHLLATIITLSTLMSGAKTYASDLENAYHMKSQCAHDAYAWLAREYGAKAASDKGFTTTVGGKTIITFLSYTDHYSPSRNACLIDLSGTMIGLGDSMITKSIIDANENTTLASFSKNVNSKGELKIVGCQLPDTTCHSERDWEQFEKSVMAQ